jgi:demethylmenaquinone methyltransferase/2-methoxy-6-polyprenyl-1,4-benzoquinol methylase
MTTSQVTPYHDSDLSKKEQVAQMFDNIAPKYDFLNHFLSLGIDVLWRKKAIRLLKKLQPKQILDIATGTGDFAFEALSLNPDKITGVDISAGMLEIGKRKIKERGLQDKMEFLLADSESLPFDNNTFDAITVAFGVRNFENLRKGLKDMHRVLKPNGSVVILEFSKPKGFPIKQFYFLYFMHILPFIGKLVSKDKTAYSYLPESVQAFPEGNKFVQILADCGFQSTKEIRLSFGIASIYLGNK